MPNIYAGMEIETPQEVLARIRQGNQAALSQARTPEQINMINTNRALDLVFGNPEVRAAEKLTGATKAAVTAADAEAKSLGMSKEQARLLQWEKLRDTFVEMGDMSRAQAIEKNMQAEMVQQLEVNKLKQGLTMGEQDIREKNTFYTLDPETMEAKAIDVSTPEGVAERNALMQQGHAVARTPGSLLNMQNADIARKHEKEMLALKMQAAKEKELYDRVAQENAAVADRMALGEVTANSLKKGLPVVAQTLDQLNAAKEIMQDPEFMTIAGKVENFTRSAKDLLGMGVLTPSEAEKYNRIIRIRAGIANATGGFRKERLGGALTAPEIEISKEYLPSKDDTPRKFLEKTMGLHKYFTVGQRRVSRALESGKWKDLTLTEQDLWNPEADQLFTPQFMQTLSPGVAPGAPRGALTIEGPKAPTAPKALTAADILNRARGAR